MVKKIITGIHESWLYIPTTSTKLSIPSWSLVPWILKLSHIFIFWFPVIHRPTQTWKDEKIVTVLTLLRIALVKGMILRWDSYRAWWKTNKGRQKSYTKVYWWHRVNRRQGMWPISESYNRLCFLESKGRWMQNNSWWIPQILWKQFESQIRTRWKRLRYN